MGRYDYYAHIAIENDPALQLYGEAGLIEMMSGRGWRLDKIEGYMYHFIKAPL